MNETTVNEPRGRDFSTPLGFAASGSLLFARGGASELALDEQRFGAIGGETRLQSPDYEGATDRYEVEVSGGASKLTVDTP